ncbi:spore germination protein [Clostridium swellfunianum]|uniref:spore germination protein n=1 Tax=Clostridium swellfunianum TaxID=1367462 RepID=UPI00202F4AE0|nr:spore germination protein [Clostridium swellfunianum]MCM0647861.1 spore germination protein [Clostridium swellfunianum]
MEFSNNLNKNVTMLKQIFNGDDTIKFREFENRYNRNLKFCIVFADGMINKEIVDEHIIEKLMNINMENINISGPVSPQTIIDTLIKKVVIAGDLKKNSSLDEVLDGMLYGDTIVLIDGMAEAIIADTKGWPVRAIDEPPSEKAVRGSREGFTESIMTNTTLIRRRIKNKDLKFNFMEIGTKTKTKIAICYVEGLAREEIVKELRNRLSNIDIDGILESEYIEEYIKDAPFSLFKTIGNTESPDVVAGKLLDGRVTVLCDGTPFVLTIPFIFLEYFQVYEDYYNNYIYSSFNRMLRFLAFFLGVSVPALYVAVTAYHQELIQTSLLLSIYSSRLGIPFPIVVEAVIMLIGFEILREAGTRLPKPIGQAVSIVGALILGDAAVNARIISAPMVIVVAATGISSFLIPKMIGVFIVVRFIFLILAALLGLYGYMFGVMGLFIYLVSLRSFGVPYMISISDLKLHDIRDTAIRAPMWLMNVRPKLITKNKIRQDKIRS